MVTPIDQYNVLVTGAAGSLGTRLVRSLLGRGVRVVALDMEEAAGRLRSSIPDGENIEIIAGNMCDQDVINAALRKLPGDPGGMPAVFHMAGMSDAAQCDRKPKVAIQQNVETLVNLLDSCVQNNVKRIIYPSTAYVYGSQYNKVIDENDACKPVGMYALTKLLGEEVLQGYSRIHSLSCDIARVSNVYGASSKPTTIFGAILFQAQNREEIKLHNLDPVRDFIFIDDVIEGFIKILESGRETGCRTYNLSTGVATSIRDLARSFCRINGLPEDVIQCDHQPGVTSKLVLDNAAFADRAGWKPGITVEEGIRTVMKEAKGLKYAQA